MIVALLCNRCRRQLGPRTPKPSIARNALRAAADGMVTPDPQAERIRQRKERKAALRAVVRTEGMVSAAKFFLSGVADLTPVSDECPDCIALQNARRGRAA